MQVTDALFRHTSLLFDRTSGDIENPIEPTLDGAQEGDEGA
jgi:hypothetical protein